MPSCNLANHLADDIIEVESCLGVRYEDFVFCFDSFPIAAVHVFLIISIPESSPNLIKDLWPFLSIVHSGFKVTQISLIVQSCFSSREVADIEIATFAENGFGGSEIHDEGSICHYIFFLSLEIE